MGQWSGLPGSLLLNCRPEADLRRAQNLTREQLDAACGDDKTKLPDDLADYQIKPCLKPAQFPSN